MLATEIPGEHGIGNDDHTVGRLSFQALKGWKRRLSFTLSSSALIVENRFARLLDRRLGFALFLERVDRMQKVRGMARA